MADKLVHTDAVKVRQGHQGGQRGLPQALLIVSIPPLRNMYRSRDFCLLQMPLGSQIQKMLRKGHGVPFLLTGTSVPVIIHSKQEQLFLPTVLQEAPYR